MPTMYTMALTLLLAAALAPISASTTFDGRQPQIAAVDDRVALTFGRDDRVYVATSSDRGTTFGEPVALPGAGAIAANGAIGVMFRNSLEGNRDMYVAVSRDAGRTFAAARKQGTGSWPLNACPMDGGDVDWAEGRIASVWRRDTEVFSVRGDGPERLLGTGTDPVLSVYQGEMDLAWTTPEGIVLRRGEKDPVRIETGRFPVILAQRDRTLMAWEHAGKVHLRAVPR